VKLNSIFLPNNSDPHTHAVTVAKSQRGKINKQRREEVQDVHMQEGREGGREGGIQTYTEHGQGMRKRGRTWKQGDKRKNKNEAHIQHASA
jgi:hypothetical protein